MSSVQQSQTTSVPYAFERAAISCTSASGSCFDFWNPLMCKIGSQPTEATVLPCIVSEYFFGVYASSKASAGVPILLHTESNALQKEQRQRNMRIHSSSHSQLRHTQVYNYGFGANMPDCSTDADNTLHAALLVRAPLSIVVFGRHISETGHRVVKRLTVACSSS